MTCAELQDAITMANAMFRASASNSPMMPALCEHLAALLQIQRERAAMTGGDKP